jgi:hypothetical protein
VESGKILERGDSPSLVSLNLFYAKIGTKVSIRFGKEQKEI